MLILRYWHWTLALIRAMFDFWHGCRNLFFLHMIIAGFFLVKDGVSFSYREGTDCGNRAGSTTLFK